MPCGNPTCCVLDLRFLSLDLTAQSTQRSTADQRPLIVRLGQMSSRSDTFPATTKFDVGYTRVNILLDFATFDVFLSVQRSYM